KDLIHFSNYNLERSIPNVMDGLKTSQRKILFSALKRNLKSEIRVAQFAGYVSEHSGYHHGEASLNDAIIGMAQDYVGSNNLAWLVPQGQFGTRLQGGNDAASPRYIHTYLQPYISSLVPTDDLECLKYRDDDGLPVEPEWYAPILPVSGQDIQLTSPNAIQPIFYLASNDGSRKKSNLKILIWTLGIVDLLELLKKQAVTSPSKAIP
ncbi:MAG: hypothetical protein EB127_16665, partial [Alphaproteobacteria bacterium]|nr:hypothetical protein [Alphaproteobacteria bacterium]